MTITGIKAWPRYVETWALNIITGRDWQLLAEVKPEVGVSCEFAHIPKTYKSEKGLGTWNGVGFFSHPHGLWVSDPSETYWRKA
jgi:hypothetical protein